jgi:N utilization substance protein A
MINKDFFIALEDLEREKGINKDIFLEALESSLVLAYKKHYGEASAISVKLNPEKNNIRVFANKTVVEEVEDPDKEISLEEAQEIKKSSKIGDVVSKEVTPKSFGRIAAQAAKQVMLQKLREAEKNVAMEEFSEKENEILTGVIRRIEGKNTFIDIGKGQIEGLLKGVDQVEGEKYNINDRIKVYVKKVVNTLKGPQVLVSRTASGLVKRLFENEVPEIRQNVVVIKAIARDPGNRTKIAVYSQDKTVDAIGACVGNRGARVNAVVSELGGEKIDIIPWCEDQLEFIAMALSPAKVLMVQANYDEKTAKVIVPDDKLSLAIGKDGQNARLAAKLTGWKIDVKSYTQSKSMPEFADLNENENGYSPEEDENILQALNNMDLENDDLDVDLDNDIESDQADENIAEQPENDE